MRDSAADKREEFLGTTTVVESARRALGPVGVFLPFSRTGAASADLQRGAARRLEHAGYRAIWVNPAPTRPR